MTAVTPTWGLTYPVLTDPPNVPAHVQQLATDVDADLTSLDARLDALEAISESKAYDARYARTAGTQAVANTTDVQVQFPTAVRTSAFVTASGANNNAFTLAPGLWIVTTTLRLSVAALTAEATIAEGNTTWVFTDVIAAGSAGRNIMVATTVYVAPATTKAVTIGTYQASGGSINIESFGASTTNVNFTRVGPREG